MGGTLTFFGVTKDGRWLWAYTCECGQTYRVTAAPNGASFWPARRADELGEIALSAGAACLGCRKSLSLDRSFHPAPTEARAAEHEETERVVQLSRLRCEHCGYGASCRAAPARCPMCGGSAWEDADVRRPRRRDTAHEGEQPDVVPGPPSAA
jgi:hypothetical protein